MKRSKAGERLYKRVDFRIFIDGKTAKFCSRAPASKGFTSDQIDEQLMELADKIEAKYPEEEFKLVPVGPAVFNFVHIGKKAA